MDLLLRLRLLLPSTGQVWEIFVFHDAFGPEFVLMHHFPSRQDCVSWRWTQPGWPVAGRDALELWPTRQAGRVFFQKSNIFGCPVATFSASKLLLLLLQLEASSESFSFIFDHLISWKKQGTILTLVAKSGVFLTPFPQIRCWMILPSPPTPPKIGNCYIIRSARSRSGSEFSFWYLLKESCMLECISWFKKLTRKCWLLSTS